MLQRNCTKKLSKEYVKARLIAAYKPNDDWRSLMNSLGVKKKNVQLIDGWKKGGKKTA